MLGIALYQRLFPMEIYMSQGGHLFLLRAAVCQALGLAEFFRISRSASSHIRRVSVFFW